MNLRPLLFVFVFVAFAPAACAPGKERVGAMQLTTRAAVVSSVAAHKTYAYDAVAPAPPGAVQWAGAPETLAVIKARIDGELAAKGYVLDPNPEVVVRVSLGVKKALEEPKGSAALAGAPVTSNDVTDLRIDLFDRASGGHLFHGSAKDELHHREPDPDRIAKQVRLILEPVPRATR